MTTDNTALFILLDQLIRVEKYDFKTALEYILSHYDSIKHKDVIRTQATNIYNDRIKGSEYDKESINSSKLWEQLYSLG